MRKKYHYVALFLTSLWFTGCHQSETVLENDTAETGTLVQVSVIDALMQGIYDGSYTTGELVRHGNLGTGGFNSLNGEMMILNDTVYQILSSGKVVLPSPDTKTPFAAITEFRADTSFSLAGTTYDSLRTNFSRYFPTPNLFYAIRIKGEFSFMKTRSVPAQAKPYPPFVVVTRSQPEFEFKNATGDVVGFFSPEFAKGIAITGLHLHFLNTARSGGGHITAFTLNKGTMEIGYINDFQLVLPEGGDFFKGNFSIDRTKELKEAEN